MKACFPLKVSDNGRHFTDSNGVPFFWHGDTCWKIFWEYTFDEAVEYLKNRAEIGFNVIQVHLLPHRIYQANRNGDPPFLEKGNICRINEAYFAHVDRVIEKAAQYGLALVVSPMWLSGWEQDWHDLFNDETAPIYAKIIAERYKDCKTIVAWIQGGDNDAPELRSAVNAAARVFRAVDPSKLQTYHAWAKGGWKFFPDAEWFDFYMAYSYSHEFLLEQIRETRAFVPAKPIVLGETHYEGNVGIDAETVRRYAYTASLCGLAGHTYGHKDIWMYTYFWQDSLTSECSHHMSRLKEFMDSIPWWELKPAENREVFRFQENESRIQRIDAHSEYFPTAFSDRLAVSYFMDHREFYPTEYWMGENFRRRWIDPVSGRVYDLKKPVSGGYRTPGTNAGGGQDWILVINE